MIDLNNLPEWLIEKPGQRFAVGFVACSLRSVPREEKIKIEKEQQGLK